MRPLFIEESQNLITGDEIIPDISLINLPFNIILGPFIVLLFIP